MPRNVDDIMAALSPERRAKIEARAAELIGEEMTLAALRKARKLTQVTVARKLGVTQDGVSRLEARSDLLLSTLRKAVEAMGGTLSLQVQFPDRQPVVLKGLGGEEWAAPANRKPPAKVKQSAKRKAKRPQGRVRSTSR